MKMVSIRRRIRKGYVNTTTIFSGVTPQWLEHFVKTFGLTYERTTPQKESVFIDEAYDVFVKYCRKSQTIQLDRFRDL